MSSIPKAERKRSKVIPTPTFIGVDDHMVFSFEILERNDYFNLDGTCPNWSSDLFAVLKQVCKLSPKELQCRHDSTLRFHNHKNAKPPCKVPDGVSLEEMVQIRIGKSKGGIHGLLIDNIFYIVWLDPQHNMYPDQRHGGLKVITPPSSCCKEREKIISEQDERIKKLEDDINAYEQLFNDSASNISSK